MNGIWKKTLLLQEGVPEELTKESSWELEQERTADEGAREKETAGEEKKNPQENSQGSI